MVGHCQHQHHIRLLGAGVSAETDSCVLPCIPLLSSTTQHTQTQKQGEEADIVVASLVRCNSAGKVGFLGEPERINVLMSRARQGLILIGSAHTLLNASNPNARKHWGVVLQQLQDAGRIYSGLPAVCQQHSSFRLPMLDSAAAFLEHAPDGGCNQPCMAVLPCGHTCKLRCHSYDREHARVRCEEPVYDLCSEGHLTTRLCSDTKTTCSTCVEIRLLQERERKEQQRLVRMLVVCGWAALWGRCSNCVGRRKLMTELTTVFAACENASAGASTDCMFLLSPATLLFHLSHLHRTASPASFRVPILALQKNTGAGGRQGPCRSRQEEGPAGCSGVCT